MSVGDNIKRLAKERGLTIYRVMKNSGVSMAYMYDLVNNKQNNPGLEILKKIAVALDVSVDELIN